MLLQNFCNHFFLRLVATSDCSSEKCKKLGKRGDYNHIIPHTPYYRAGNNRGKKLSETITTQHTWSYSPHVLDADLPGRFDDLLTLNLDYFKCKFCTLPT